MEVLLNVITCLRIDLFPQFPNTHQRQDHLHLLPLLLLFGWLMTMIGAITSKTTMMTKTCIVHGMEVTMKTVTREDCQPLEETVLVDQARHQDWLDSAALSASHEPESGRSFRVTDSMFLLRSWLTIISMKMPSTLLVEEVQLDAHHLILHPRLCRHTRRLRLTLLWPRPESWHLQPHLLFGLLLPDHLLLSLLPLNTLSPFLT